MLKTHGCSYIIEFALKHPSAGVGSYDLKTFGLG